MGTWNIAFDTDFSLNKPSRFVIRLWVAPAYCPKVMPCVGSVFAQIFRVSFNAVIDHLPWAATPFRMPKYRMQLTLTLKSPVVGERA